MAARDGHLLEKLIRDGCVIVDDCVDQTDIDGMSARLDGLWDSETPIPHLVLLGLRETPEAEPRNLPHAEVLRLDLALQGQRTATPAS